MITKRLLCSAMFLLVLGLEPSGLHAADNFWKTLAKKKSSTSSNATPVSSGAPMISLGESRFIAQGIAGQNATSKKFSVRNVGSGELNFSVNRTPEWLKLDPPSGSMVGEEAVNVDVVYETARLTPGSYIAKIMVQDPAATNSPQSIPVYLTVLPKAVMTMSTSNLNFRVKAGASMPTVGAIHELPLQNRNPSKAGQNSESQMIRLKSTGMGTTSYQISSNADWISWMPKEVAVSANEEAVILVQVNPSRLAVGTYAANLRLELPGAEIDAKIVQVNLSVMSDQTISIDANSLNVSCFENKNALPQSFNMENNGRAPLKYRIVAKPAWVSVKPTAGELAPGQSVSVNVHYETWSFRPGTQSAEILITQEGETMTQKIPVELRVLLPPIIGLDIPQIDLEVRAGESLGEMPSFTLSNPGSGKLVYRLTTEASWVSFEPKSGEVAEKSRTSIRVFVRPESLAPGTYEAAILITDPNAANNPQKLPVSMTIEAKSKVFEEDKGSDRVRHSGILRSQNPLPQDEEIGKSAPLSESATPKGRRQDDDRGAPKELVAANSAGSDRIPDALLGLVLNAGNGVGQDRYLRRENSNRGDEAKIEFSREQEMEVKDSFGVVTKIQAWNLSVQVFLYSPQARWGGFPEREYAELWRSANAQRQSQYQEALPVKGAEESLVLKKTLDAGLGETTEAWRFLAMKDGVVVSMEAETGKSLLKATGQTMDFYPFMDQILKGGEDKIWEAIFKKENPKFDLLPATLKPVVINLGTIESGGIDLRLDKMPGFAQMALRYSTESIRRSEEDPAWRLNVRVVFYSPAKEGRVTAERMIESRFKSPGRGQKGTRISKGDGGIKMVGGDFLGISYNIRVGAAFLELEFQPLNKEFMDPPVGVMDELIQKMRGVESKELFDSILNREPDGVRPP